MCSFLISSTSLIPCYLQMQLICKKNFHIAFFLTFSSYPVHGSSLWHSLGPSLVAKKRNVTFAIEHVIYARKIYLPTFSELWSHGQTFPTPFSSPVPCLLILAALPLILFYRNLCSLLVSTKHWLSFFFFVSCYISIFERVSGKWLL